MRTHLPTPGNFIIVIVALLLAPLTLANAVPKRWSHLELGAANYGPQDTRSAFAELSGRSSQSQFQVLEDTVERLIRDRGPDGDVYVNDLTIAKTRFVAEHLRGYLEHHGHASIRVIEEPGDFTKIRLPEVDSIDLKNPQDTLFSRTRNLGQILRKIANQSRSGLRILTHMDEELQSAVDPTVAEISERQGFAPDPYIYPDGTQAERVPSVYIVSPECGDKLDESDRLTSRDQSPARATRRSTL